MDEAHVKCIQGYGEVYEGHTRPMSAPLLGTPACSSMSTLVRDCHNGWDE